MIHQLAEICMVGVGERALIGWRQLSHVDGHSDYSTIQEHQFRDKNIDFDFDIVIVHWMSAP